MSLQENEYPNLQDYFIKIGLYKKIRFPQEVIFKKPIYLDLRGQWGPEPDPNLKFFTFLESLVSHKTQIDCYCPSCKKDRIFNPLEVINPGEGILGNGFVCTANEEHTIWFFTKVNKTYIEKVGQFNSFSDFQGIEFDKYNSILTSEKIDELKKAVGLFSHGIGIGSFVYLRRIIEFLVDIERDKTNKNPFEGWNDNKYAKSRFKEKILLLKDRLPSFLVNNAQIYSLLSNGIHGLSETECMNCFEILLDGITQILEDSLHEQKKKIKEQKTTIALKELEEKQKNDNSKTSDRSVK
ncbi:MAG TPA: hypothetical protein VK590_03605 [Saprospiraceae bacterium]|nr:hypothetical protein [Saprospiraceae bacterium]